MTEPSSASEAPRSTDSVSPTDEAATLLRHAPGRVEVHLPSLDALFDPHAEPDYPHTGPMVARSLAKFLIDSAREQRSQPEIVLAFVVEGVRPAPNVETEARTRLQRYFAVEAEVASLDLRINRSEGLGSLRYSIPLVALALLVAGLFYSQLGSSSGEGYLEALTYLVFITIVWVMLWDPLEMLLFTSYMIRLRVRALRKLARALVSFTYRADPGAPPPGGPRSA